MTNVQHPVHRIELRVQELAQLFNSMDPTPFHHKDLDRDAEAFIESWALEFPQDSRFHITVHLGQMPPEDPTALVSLIHISEPTRLGMISYAVFCLKKKKTTNV